MTDYTPFADEELQEEEEAYGARLEELREMIRESYQTTMTGYMEELEQLYQNKIVEFENMDDIYARKAADCYWKYSSASEAVFDGLEWLGDAAEGLVTGAMDGGRT